MKKAELYDKFWSNFLNYGEGKTILPTKAPSGRGSMCLGYSNGLAYYYVLKGKKSHVAFYIARPSERVNKRIFDNLFKHKDEIETTFGDSLTWQRLDYAVPCRIRYEMEIGDYENNESNWGMIQKEMINAMDRLKKSLFPFIK